MGHTWSAVDFLPLNEFMIMLPKVTSAAHGKLIVTAAAAAAAAAAGKN
jgi:hypothetical protein